MFLQVLSVLNYMKIKSPSPQIKWKFIFDLTAWQKSKTLVIHTLDKAVGRQPLSSASGRSVNPGGRQWDKML